MTRGLLKCCVFSLCFFAMGYCRKLPPFVEICHRSDPKISECLLRNMESLRPKFIKGIPELFIPPTGPLVIPEAHLNTGNSMNATFKNIEIYGVETFAVNDIDFDPKTLLLNISLTIPHCRIKSEYNIKGRLLVLQLDGTGPVDGNFTNLRGRLEASGKHVMKKGKDHVKFDINKIDVEAGKPHIIFGHLFGDNEEINEQTNKLINENIEQIIAEILPILKDILLQFFTGISNRLCDKYSFDELFPE